MLLNKTIQTILFLAGFTSLIAQNNFESIAQEFILENPAYFLTDESYHVSLFRKRQWKDFKINNTITVQKSISQERLCVGVVFTNNTYTSTFNENELSIPLSYQIRLARGKLSMGLEPGIKQGVLNGENLYSPDIGDPFFSLQRFSKVTFKTGFFYRDEKLDIGVSFNDLIESKDFLNDRYLSVLLGRNFYISDRLIYHPFLYIRFKERNVNQVLLRNQFEYSNSIIFSLLVDQSKKGSFSLGVDMEKIIPRLMEDISVFYSYGKHFNELASLGAVNEFGLIYKFSPLPSKNKVKKRVVNHSGVLFD